MSKCLYFAILPNMNVDLFCYFIERDWVHYLPEPTWTMKPADRIPTGERFQEPGHYERLFSIHYHLNGLGGGFGAVYALQQSPSQVYVRIDETTGLDRLFFSPSMAVWLLDRFGVQAAVDWNHTNDQELRELERKYATIPPAELEEQIVAPEPEPMQTTRIEPLARGRRNHEAYDRAFRALYLDKTVGTRREAFRLYILSEDPAADAADEENRYNAFKSAMNSRTKKRRKGG